MANQAKLEYELFSKKSVLIVDPADNIRNTIASMLKELGFSKITLASNSNDALAQINVQKFDIIITEHLPPRVDGLGIINKIRKEGRSLKSSIIMISSNLEQKTVLNAVTAGVSEFIVKPFSLRILRERLLRAIASPLKAEYNENPQQEAVQTLSESKSRPSILVVDDVPDNIKVVSEVLKSDYKIQAATSAKNAFKICLSATPPDMVLLDIMMPEMDGLSLCRKLKNHPKTHHIAIIFISAMDQNADVVKGLEIGAVDYITKPISPQILLARVKTHLKLTVANRQLRQQVDLTVDYSQMRNEFDKILEFDIKKPLNNITSAVNSLLEAKFNPIEFENTASSIAVYAAMLDNYINNLHLSRKLESQSYRKETITLDAGLVAREAIEKAAVISQANSIEVLTNFRGGLLLKGDQALFDALLNNLVLHALDTASNNSSVRVNIFGFDDKIEIKVNNDWHPTVEERISFFERISASKMGSEQATARNTIKLLTEALGAIVSYDNDDKAGTSINVEFPL